MSYATTVASPRAATFRHQPPSLLMQWLMALGMNGVMRPLMRSLEAIGRADRFLSSIAAQGRKRQEQNPFVRYTPGPQDVVVMTFPKSGTNWMMQIAHQLIHHGRGEYDHIHDLIPWPDIETMPGFMRRYAVPLAQATGWKSSPERKRVIKTHFNWDLIPYSPEARYIAVIRDPKDVFVSSYFFLKDGVYGSAMPKLDTWYRVYLSKNFMMGGSWATNAAGYWAARQRPNVLVLSFKSMKKDLRATVKTVAAFLGIAASETLIDEVYRLSTFDYMKSIDHKFNMGKLIPWREAGAMIRKGRQSGSSELLTPARQREIDAHFQAELREIGSDFPYAEFCELAR
jgi:sulfotransferase family protein